MPRRRSIESRPLFDAEPLPDFASSPEEIQRAVQRNAVQRGQFFALNLARLGFDEILDQVQALARESDMEEWRAAAERLAVDPAAMDVLDRAAVPYVFYFCDPEQLVKNPTLVIYYRNVAMISAKVMSGIGLNTVPYELGEPLPPKRAQELSNYFNSTVSKLIAQNPSLITPRRHIEMALSNFGDGMGGAWRNEVGRLAYAEVIGMLLRYFHNRGCLLEVAVDVKRSLVVESEDADASVMKDQRLTDGPDFLSRLEELETRRVVYRTVYLRNGHELQLNRQMIWRDPQGIEYKIGPDLSAITVPDQLDWSGELKGGADPAGSDEHWKTASRAFDRILEAAEKTNRQKPKLSFLATILVDRVAREAQLWINQGKLASVYNLTQIAENEAKRDSFLRELSAFLDC